MSVLSKQAGNSCMPPRNHQFLGRPQLKPLLQAGQATPTREESPVLVAGPIPFFFKYVFVKRPSKEHQSILAFLGL